MNDVVGRILDYLGYRNKQQAAAWEERLWQQHLRGDPQDLRHDKDRQHYQRLAEQATQARVLARNLHQRRMRFLPRFTSAAPRAESAPALPERRKASR